MDTKTIVNLLQIIRIISINSVIAYHTYNYAIAYYTYNYNYRRWHDYFNIGMVK